MLNRIQFGVVQCLESVDRVIGSIENAPLFSMNQQLFEFRTTNTLTE